ncbi:class I glutamine amidotransferase-like protein [Cryphonectria parasitica EP155]|uniref:Class I glutamine amidotransferase-like protein n=1 Tax=Cryphonectria parasitica (strain ATCC 38755 / EP155) TaxID=660469 RepID=A0A9P5CQ53_CRYP1|nr:class I glutamine amidotransferase-like protein [Cryphonectria parasitica EP155]KAF3767164.1 class I glutamine amidotransferase-like protein [Cryphonectria parasitica EP155]
MGSSTTPLRLAILEADTPLPNTKAKFHGYGGVFTDLFRRAVAPDPLETHLRITTHHIVADGPGGDADAAAAYPDLADLDAILVSGSKHSAYLDEPWINRLIDFTRKALATNGRVKVVGVCFGHQIVSRALGTRVAVNEKGWEVSVTNLKLSEKGRELFGSDTLKIHQMHRDIVFGTPEGAEDLAATDVCSQQGYLLPGKAITVQGHPEFTETIVSEILGLRHDTKIFSDDMYQSGMDRVGNEHDGERIARVFLKFMRGQLG